MSTTRRLLHPAQLCAAVCALLLSATSGAAFAAPDLLAPERYYSSFGTTDSSQARAQEQYYSSYGDPAPLPRDDPAEASWLPIALSIAGALSIAAVGATQVMRVRVRRRAARAAA